MNEKNHKRIVCEICSEICGKKEKRSEYVKSLIQHFREKHGETLKTSEGAKSLQCFFCDKRFRNEVSCKFHILDKHKQNVMIEHEKKIDDDIRESQLKMEIKVEIKFEPEADKHEYFEEMVGLDSKPEGNFDDVKAELSNLEETWKDDNVKQEDRLEKDNDIKKKMFNTLKLVQIDTLKENKCPFKPFPRPDRNINENSRTRINVENPVMLLGNQFSAVPTKNTNTAQYSILPSFPPPRYQYMPPCQYRQSIPPPQYPIMPHPSQYPAAPSSKYPAIPPFHYPAIPPNQYQAVPPSQYTVPPPGFPCIPLPSQFPPIHPSQYPIVLQDLSMPPPLLPLSWYSIMPPPVHYPSPQCPAMPPSGQSLQQADQNQFGSVSLNQLSSSYCNFDHTGKLIQRRDGRSTRWGPY